MTRSRPALRGLLVVLLGGLLLLLGPSVAEAQQWRSLLGQGWTYMEAGNFRKAEESFKAAFETQEGKNAAEVYYAIAALWWERRNAMASYMWLTDAEKASKNAFAWDGGPDGEWDRRNEQRRVYIERNFAAIRLRAPNRGNPLPPLADPPPADPLLREFTDNLPQVIDEGVAEKVAVQWVLLPTGTYWIGDDLVALESNDLNATNAEAWELPKDGGKLRRTYDERVAAIAKGESPAELLAAETAEAERLAKVAAEEKQRAEEKAERERLAAEKADRERKERERIAAAEKAEAERLAREEIERERLAAEKAALALAEKERIASEKAAAEKAEQERLAAERAAADKAEQERLAAERAAADKAEKERLAAEQAERDRIAAAEKAERDRIAAAEKAERDRVAAAEKAERDRIAAADRAERERVAAADKAERERLEAERAAAEKAERERVAAADKAERERVAAAERAERERLAAADKAEREQQEWEQAQARMRAEQEREREAEELRRTQLREQREVASTRGDDPEFGKRRLAISAGGGASTVTAMQADGNRVGADWATNAKIEYVAPIKGSTVALPVGLSWANLPVNGCSHAQTRANSLALHLGPRLAAPIKGRLWVAGQLGAHVGGAASFPSNEAMASCAEAGKASGGEGVEYGARLSSDVGSARLSLADLGWTRWALLVGPDLDVGILGAPGRGKTYLGVAFFVRYDQVIPIIRGTTYHFRPEEDSSSLGLGSTTLETLSGRASMARVQFGLRGRLLF